MRKRWWVIAIVVGVWWMWPRSQRVLDLQVATTRSGFAIYQRDADRMREIDGVGDYLRDYAVPRLSDDTRVVGTRVGPAVVWRDGRKVFLALADNTVERQSLGKRVERLCKQTASGNEGFAVAWMERDGAIWFVHGSTATEAGAMLAFPAELDDEGAEPPFCGITRAGSELALLYRNGRRVELVRCGKRCSPPDKVALPKDADILAFGCTQQQCLVATRTGRTTTLHWVNVSGKTIAKRELDGSNAGAVAIEGRSNRFAIAYAMGPHAVVAIADAPGLVRPELEVRNANSTPSLTWRADSLLVATQQEGRLFVKVLD
jgi:hypothetical protein